MSRSRIVIVVALAVMLSSAFLLAQQVRVVGVDPIVVTGGAIGFRDEARHGSAAVGKLVVRIDGKWVETEIVPRALLTIPER